MIDDQASLPLPYIILVWVLFTSFLLMYFGQSDVDSISRTLPDQVLLFSGDAREACAKWKVEYPDGFESAILKYLKKNGIMQ